MKFWIHCVAATVALACASVAFGFGDTFRCGVKIIKVGDTEQALQDACGRPSSRRTSMENVRDATGKTRPARIENYIYEDRDRHSTVNIWVLEGEIVRIDNR